MTQLAFGTVAPTSRRAVAYIIDAVIAGGLGVVLGIILSISVAMAGLEGALGVLAIGGPLIWLVMLGWFVVYTLMQSGKGSIGMRAQGLRLAQETTGAPLGFWKTLLRNVVFGASAAIVVGYFTPLFDGSGRFQGWHDKVAKSVMLDARTSPLAPEAPRTRPTQIPPRPQAPMPTAGAPQAAQNPLFPQPVFPQAGPPSLATPQPASPHPAPPAQPGTPPIPGLPAPTGSAGFAAPQPAGPQHGVPQPAAPQLADPWVPAQAPAQQQPPAQPVMPVQPVTPAQQTGQAPAPAAVPNPAAQPVAKAAAAHDDPLIAFVPGITQDAPPVRNAPDAPNASEAPAAPAVPNASAASAASIPEETQLRGDVIPAPVTEDPADIEDTRISIPGHRLVFTWDDGTKVSVSQRTIFGRNPAAEQGAVTVSVRDETLSLSKTHFEASAEASGGWITDRNSTNGTVIVRDGHRIICTPGEPVRIRLGDAIEIGDRIVTIGGYA